MSNPGFALENAQSPVAQDLTDTLMDRVVIGAVKGIVWLWCLPFLLIALVLTWTAIAVCRTVQLAEILVRVLAGRSHKPGFQSVHGRPLSCN